MANLIDVTVKDHKVKLLSETGDTSLYALCHCGVQNDVPRNDHVEYSILFQILLEWLTKEIFPRSACTRVTDILLVDYVCDGCKH
jgi:hypothetical protein